MNQALSFAVNQAIFAGRETFSPYLVLQVSRSSILADTLEQIQLVDANDLKKPLKV